MNAGRIIKGLALALALAPAGRAAAQGSEDDPHAIAYARSGNFVVTGRVADVDPVQRKLVITRDKLPAVELYVPGDARVRDGDDRGLEALDEGESVRASFNLDGATPVAVDVRSVKDKSEHREGYRRRLFRWTTETPP